MREDANSFSNSRQQDRPDDGGGGAGGPTAPYPRCRTTMKLSRTYAAAATTLLVAVLHIQPGTASAPAAAAVSRRRTQWWAEALGAGDVGGGGGGNERPVPRPTNPPPTLPTGGDYLQFVDREPNFRLGRCEGDCDKDSVRSTLFI